MPALAAALDDADDLRDRLKATSDALNEARNEAADLRHKVADLAEERDLLVRQLQAIRAVLDGAHEHEWSIGHGLAALVGVPICATCGVVRRRDGANALCKGPRRIELREP